MLRIFCGIIFCLAGLSAISKERTDKELYDAAGDYIRTPYYVHQWVRFPKVTGQTVKEEPVDFTPQKGSLSVVFFLASWCVPCQNYIEKFKEIQKNSEKLNVEFHYVFTHDTKKDILGFQEFYKISPVVIGDSDVEKNFHNPPLPSIYVADKDGFLLQRYLEVTEKDLEDLVNLLKILG